MKSVKTPLTMVLILAASVLLGVILLCLAFLLPTSPIYEHVKNSSYIFVAEGEYPYIDHDSAKILDNYTDSIMLGNAIFKKEDASLLEHALNVYRLQYDDSLPTYSLLASLNGYEGGSWAVYPRYWHGYLIFLKPLLLITDYLGIRTASQIACPMLAVLILAALLKCGHKKLVVPFLAVFLFLRSSAVALSLQNSAVFYLSMASVLCITLWNETLKKGNRFLYYFLVLGILTNYLDFLTYPIATLGISAVMYLAMTNHDDIVTKIRSICFYSLSWAFGYFGMWIGKWTAASALLGTNVFQDAMDQARFRVSNVVDGHRITPYDAIYKNMMVGFGGIKLLAAVILILALLYGLFKCRFRPKPFLIHAMPYLLIGLMPFGWYTVLQNHSFIHPAFTYRSLSVLVFSLAAMGFTAPDPAKTPSSF